MEPQRAPCWTPSMLAFASEGPFLAAGTTPDGEEKPSLRILRATPGRGALVVVTSFPSPAPFCRVAWSNALAYGCSTSPVGLIAGGLQSGVVMAWDPQHKLRFLDWDSPKYHDAELAFKVNLQSGRFMSRDIKVFDDYFAPEKLREPTAVPPRLCQTTRNLLTPGSVPAGMVASFRPQSSPVAGRDRGVVRRRPLVHKRTVEFTGGHASLVAHAWLVQNATFLFRFLTKVRGLSFSSSSPALLASGSEEGQVMVWDLSNQLAQPVPTFQYVPNPSINISSLAWSKLLPNILACTSFGGKTSVLDLSSKSPVLSDCECMRRCSAVDFSPVDEKLLVVSCDDYSQQPSILVWDLRKMTEPVSMFCQDTEGVNAMSWSPWNDHSLLVTTNDRKAIVLDVQKKQVLVEMETRNRCFDVHWNKTAEKTFVAASNEKLTMYQLE